MASSQRSYLVTRHLPGSPDEIWPLVGEARRWKEWAGVTRSFLEREGSPQPDGVGAVRRFLVGPAGSREKVLAWEPPTHLAYTIVSGFPVDDYRSDIYLEGDGDNTLLTWSATFRPKIVGTGLATQVALHLLITNFARRLERHLLKSKRSSIG